MSSNYSRSKKIAIRLVETKLHDQVMAIVRYRYKDRDHRVWFFEHRYISEPPNTYNGFTTHIVCGVVSTPSSVAIPISNSYNAMHGKCGDNNVRECIFDSEEYGIAHLIKITEL